MLTAVRPVFLTKTQIPATRPEDHHRVQEFIIPIMQLIEPEKILNEQKSEYCQNAELSEQH